MSKKKLLNKILWEVNEEGIGCREWKLLLDGIETLNDFKSNLEWQMNHVSCCEDQLHKNVQYHYGRPYYYHPSDLLRMKRACISLAHYVGYELHTNVNGFWNAKSIK